MAPTSSCPVCQHSFDGLRHAGVCPRCALAHLLQDSAGPGGSTAGTRSEGRRAGEAPEGVLTPGAAWGDFDLIVELGRGGMGTVWLALQRDLDRLVALKVINTGLTGDEAAALEARLVREARAAAALSHPGIVTVYEIGRHAGRAFLTMEHIEGGDLRTRLREGPLAPRAAATIVQAVASALAHAHAVGVLHRDLKPANILLGTDGAPRLADFGLAAAAGGAHELTRTGLLTGTPTYLAPELIGGAHATAATDLYAVGAVLYELLTGRPPFIAASASTLFAQIAGQEPVAPRRLVPALPRDLETITLKLLEKRPAARYPTATAAAADLAAFLADRPIAARPLSPAGRALRWARRNPALALASATAVVALVATAVISTGAAVRLGHAAAAEAAQRALAEAARARAETETRRATAAEDEARTQLRAALLAQAHATRLTGRAGQQASALGVLQRAAALGSGIDLRSEAAAALAGPDLVEDHTWPLPAGFTGLIGMAPAADYIAFTWPDRIEVRTAAEGTLVHTLPVAGGPVESAPQFSPSGRWLAARTASRRTHVWDLRAGGREVLVLDDRRYVLSGGRTGFGTPDVFSADDTLLASTRSDSGVSLHRLPGGEIIAEWPSDGATTHLAFSPDGTRLAIGRALRKPGSPLGANLQLVSVTQPDAPPLRVPTVNDPYGTLLWSPDGSRVVCDSSEFQLLDPTDGRRLSAVRDPDAHLALPLAPDASRLLTINQSGRLGLWDVRNARLLLQDERRSGGDLAVTPDFTRLVQVGARHVATVRLATSPVLTPWPSASADWDNVMARGSVLAVSPDDRLLATAVWGAVHLRDATGRVLAEQPLGKNSNTFTSVAFADDGRALYVCDQTGGFARLPLVEERTATGASTWRFGPREVFDPEPGFVLAALAPSAGRAALVSWTTGTVKTYALDPATGRAQLLTRWTSPGACQAAFRPEGTALLVVPTPSFPDEPARIHDPATGAILQALALRGGTQARVSPDGRWFVAGGARSTTALVATADFAPGPALPEELQGPGRTCAVSADGRTIAVASGATITLYDLERREVLVRLEGPPAGAFTPALTFSRDGARLIVLWEYGQLHCWDLAALRRELRTLELDW